ncbi:MAG: exodeoxyribonuclease V subunit alpha, partial [Lentisphaeraceae bacterium]|nr:exodeoxyribonuclease V subunit alpha [Lentisphaeraceae bacterium]
SEELYLAVLCISFSATRQFSALPLHGINGLYLHEFCGSRNISEIKIDLTNYHLWPEKYSKTVGLDGEQKPLILDEQQGLLYLNKYYYAEKGIAEFVKQMNQREPLSSETISSLNLLFQSDINPDWQKVAAFTALRNRFCVISGGPGTGKTTTVARILSLLLQQNPDLKIDLLAPTGKAADRLGEAIASVTNELLDKGTLQEEIAVKIPQNASTIHRFLGTKPGSKNFLHNEKKKSTSDLVLIDESSMVSLPLFHSLLKALKKNCRLILLGDKDQLTAVETGNVLGELTSSENLNTFSREFCEAYSSAADCKFKYVNNEADELQDLVLKLEHSYRFGTESPVGRLADLINNPPNEIKPSHFKELFKEPCSASEYVSFTELPETFDRNTLMAISTLKSYFENYKIALQAGKPEEIIEILNNLRILTATRIGPFGSETVNREISRAFFNHDDNDLYNGRCIMISTNDHSLELYNGDVGVILIKDDVPTAWFPGKNGELRSFSPSVLPDFETSFAMTIHKSQGSEYNQIIMLLPESDLISRQLVYTGITRARKSVEIISEIKTLIKASKNSIQRFSGLRKRK